MTTKLPATSIYYFNIKEQYFRLIVVLNQWGDDTCFLKHLDKLNESSMYKALTEAHTAEILERLI